MSPTDSSPTEGRPTLGTHIAVHRADGVTVRGRDLVGDLVGKRTFTELLYFLVCERDPDPFETRMLDACLVMLAESGINVSTLVSRLMAYAVPGEPQVAMGAGLMSLGDVFVGSAEGCGGILERVVDASPDRKDAICTETVTDLRERRSPLPGFGHGTHTSDDPRATRLLELADGGSERMAEHLDALARLAAAVDAVHGRHIPVNVTGATAALLLGIGVPLGGLRGLAVVARSGGLLGHVLEEQETRSARRVWTGVRDQFSYLGPEAP